MTTVVLEMCSLADALAATSRVMKISRAEREARIGLATPELLWQVLAARRWPPFSGTGGRDQRNTQNDRKSSS